MTPLLGERRAGRQGRRLCHPGARRGLRGAHRGQLFRRDGPAAVRDRGAPRCRGRPALAGGVSGRNAAFACACPIHEPPGPPPRMNAWNARMQRLLRWVAGLIGLAALLLALGIGAFRARHRAAARLPAAHRRARARGDRAHARVRFGLCPHRPARPGDRVPRRPRAARIGRRAAGHGGRGPREPLDPALDLVPAPRGRARRVRAAAPARRDHGRRPGPAGGAVRPAAPGRRTPADDARAPAAGPLRRDPTPCSKCWTCARDRVASS